ncbi:NUDIX domain-containing protein [Oryzobacter terrae]|uniref:NUDIX hydrolase n=1 Tax=Oryzobacter terrae TaxID=1620385 RepID=UPI0036733635
MSPTRIPAAGTLPWRLRDETLEVALVHRPRYDDWSWAKGKLDPGEDWAVAAARETEEETGLVVRLGPALPESRYVVLDRGEPGDKVVRYWSAQVTGGHGRLLNEIDEVVWLPVPEAHARLDYARDRDQLLALVRLQQGDRLDTWPLVLVRHAHAVPRGDYDGADDTKRPLTEAGSARARELVPVLGAYGVTRVVSSPSERCVGTVEPYARAVTVKVRRRDGLSEEGHAEAPLKARTHVRRLLERGEPALLCSHGPVMPSILDELAGRLDLDAAGAVEVVEAFAEARDDRLAKGEALVCHVVGTGDGARVVAVERHLP